MKLIEETESYQILCASNGETLWVNGEDGSLIGRFSKAFGIDVHNLARDQIEGNVECFYCTHGRANETDWLTFRPKMAEHHQIEIDRQLMQF
jgi:hypothetical protein